MRIILDESKAQGMIDSHPDTPEQEEYYEVNKIDTIEIADKELNEIGEAYNVHVDTELCAIDSLSLALSRIKPFSRYFKELIELKIAEKEKK